MIVFALKQNSEEVGLNMRHICEPIWQLINNSYWVLKLVQFNFHSIHQVAIAHHVNKKLELTYTTLTLIHDYTDQHGHY